MRKSAVLFFARLFVSERKQIAIAIFFATGRSEMGDLPVTVANVYPKDKSVSFHVTSFIKVINDIRFKSHRAIVRPAEVLLL